MNRLIVLNTISSQSYFYLVNFIFVSTANNQHNFYFSSIYSISFC